MLHLILRRIALSAPLVVIVTALAFLLDSLAPGDLARTILGADGTPEQYDALRRQLGLDRPLITQYLDSLWRALHGDLGQFFFTKESVASLIAARAGVTIAIVLGVGGDSAGGNLAAAMGWMARDAAIPLAAILLLYPATNLAGMRDDWVRRSYFGEHSDEVRSDPRASPALADLRGVAPTILGVGPYDFLYQDNLGYVAALEKAGVDLTLRIFPGLNHGFFRYTAISGACEAAANPMCDDLAARMKA